MQNSVDDFINLDKEYVFLEPKKCENNLYVSELQEKCCIKLPNLSILDTGVDEFKNKVIAYLIDENNEEHTKLLELFNNLDKIAVKKAHENSLSWFGKKIKLDSLNKMYMPPYSSTKDNKIYVKFCIDEASKDIDLSKFEMEHGVDISIEGLVFYKNTYNYKININNIRLLKDIEEVSNIDFLDTLNSRKNAVNKLSNLDIDDTLLEKQTIDRKTILSMAKDANLLDDESILQNDGETNTVIVVNDEESINSNISKLDLQKLLDISRQKVKQCIKNAERATKAAEGMRIKSVEAASEVEKYSNMLNTN